MSDNQDLIVIKQLPIIVEQFRQIAAEVKKKAEYALSLPCTEETKTEVKKLRADLNADKKDLEARRIAVKKAVMKPYDEMEAVYKQELLSLFNETDGVLSERIAVIEDTEKAEKTFEVMEYFNEYAESLGLIDVPFEAAGLNITLSVTAKALKEQAKAFLDGVSEATAMIQDMQDSAEIMAEYKKSYNAVEAIKTVKDRHKAIEKEQGQLDNLKSHQAEVKESEAKVNAVLAPVIVDDDSNEVVRCPFVVTDTRAKVRALREYMQKEGIKYEQFTSK